MIGFMYFYNMSGRVVSDIQTRAEGIRIVYLIQHGRSCYKWFVKLSKFVDLLAK